MIKVIFKDGTIKKVKPNLAHDLIEKDLAEKYEDKQFRPKKGKKKGYKVK